MKKQFSEFFETVLILGIFALIVLYDWFNYTFRRKEFLAESLYIEQLDRYLL